MDFNNFYISGNRGINTVCTYAIYFFIHDVNVTSLSCKLKQITSKYFKLILKKTQF